VRALGGNADMRWRVELFTEKYQPAHKKCAWIYTGNHISVSTPVFNIYWVIEYLLLTKMMEIITILRIEH
jgi:hypothetical protein